MSDDWLEYRFIISTAIAWSSAICSSSAPRSPIADMSPTPGTSSCTIRFHSAVRGGGMAVRNRPACSACALMPFLVSDASPAASSAQLLITVMPPCTASAARPCQPAPICLTARVSWASTVRMVLSTVDHAASASAEASGPGPCCTRE